MTTTHSEIQDLKRELFRDNVYRAERVFNDRQLWLDAGCHVGLFSTLAEAYGAAVIGGIDTDPLMVGAYQDRLALPAVQHHVASVRDLVDATWNFGAAAEHVNALKMDIQGAEIPMLLDRDEARLLSIGFPTLLFEYHDATTITDALAMLTSIGYDIQFCDRATDALTRQPTYIVHATERNP
jgi:hypothetical protein